MLIIVIIIMIMPILITMTTNPFMKKEKINPKALTEIKQVKTLK